MPKESIFTSKQWLFLILAIYLCLGVGYSVTVPLGEAPDELDHFLYIKHLQQEHRFPILSAIPEENKTMEANQPPLYYLLALIPTIPIPIEESIELPHNSCFSFDPSDNGRANFYQHTPEEQFPYKNGVLAFHLARLFSLSLGLGTILSCYWLAQQLTTDQQFPLFAITLLAFNPQFIFMNATVNNDNLSTMLGALILAKSVHLTQKPTLNNTIITGILLGAGLLTKFSLLAFWPLPIIAVTILWWEKRSDPNQRSPFNKKNSLLYLQRLTILLLIPILLAFPWYNYTNNLYGDPLAWDLHLQAKGAFVLRTTPLQLSDLKQFFMIHFQSYWAWFGWLKLKAPIPLYYILLLVHILSAVGGARYLWYSRKEWTLFSTKLTNKQQTLLLSSLAVAAIYTSLFRYILTINWSGYQGRLAYSAAAPIALLLAFGLWQLNLPKWSKHLISLFFPIFALSSLLFIIHPNFKTTYAPPLSINYTPTCARFDNGFHLDGLDLPHTVQPNQPFPLTLYGFGAKKGDGALFLTINGRFSQQLFQQSIPLRWEKNQPYSQTIEITLPRESAPTRATIELNFTEQISATSPTGRQLPQPLTPLTFKIAPITAVSTAPTQQRIIQFDPYLTLLGYDLQLPNKKNLTQSEPPHATLRLYWETKAEMSADYTTFLHLTDAEGNLLSQIDAQPAQGAYPTSIWSVNERVIDEKQLPLPTNPTLTNKYRIYVGIYLLETGERILPATNEPLLILEWK